MTISQELARFSSRLEISQIPAQARTKALHHIADWLANGAAGFFTEFGKAMAGLISLCSGGAPIAGTLAPADPLSAALVNGGCGHCLEFDDADRAGLVHPGVPVISSAWSAAALQPVSGPDFLAAVVAGYEVCQRIARAVNPEHYKIWHTTGTIGSLGAAAAAARVMGLDYEKTAWALGLAGTQAAGLWEVLPDAPDAKNLHPAKAAHSGVLAAILARNGVGGPLKILEGKRGVFAAMVSRPVSADECLRALNRRWLILEATLKAYPVCGHTMTPIEAALRLHPEIDPVKIESVKVTVHPVAIQVAGNPNPKTEAQAKFSIPYCVALALVKGRVNRADFSPLNRINKLVSQVMDRVILTSDPHPPKNGGGRPAKVAVTLQSGDIKSAEALFRKGDPENPLSDLEMESKFKGLTAPVWGKKASNGVWRKLKELSHATDIAGWWSKLPRPNLQQ